MISPNFYSKLKVFYMNETYYNIVINRTSAERLKLEQNDQCSKGFKYQSLDNEPLDNEPGQVVRKTFV